MTQKLFLFSRPQTKLTCFSFDSVLLQFSRELNGLFFLIPPPRNTSAISRLCFYVPAHHFLAQPHEEKSLNHLYILSSININHLSNSVKTPVASSFLLHTIVVVIVVILYSLMYLYFKIYSAIRLSSCKCVINSVFSVQKFYNDVDDRISK